MVIMNENILQKNKMIVMCNFVIMNVLQDNKAPTEMDTFLPQDGSIDGVLSK